MFYPESKFNLPLAADEAPDKSATEEAAEEADETGAVFLEDTADEPYAAWDTDTPHSEKNESGQTRQK